MPGPHPDLLRTEISGGGLGLGLSDVYETGQVIFLAARAESQSVGHSYT